ncbi:MAG: macrolide family glycosyltransferase [Actinophytocola sp.]|uniref:macrolide family glycosyltransferase n=1 Tax=Actinophytocola sp. TaxID=1872138 RepID=UPI003C72B3B1
MSHIVIAGCVGVGHAIPTLDTIAELVARGHRVTCVTVPLAAATLAPTGAHIVPIDSVLATVDLTVMDTVTELDRLMVLGVEEDRRFIAAVEEYAELQGRPDLLVFDATRFAVGRILGTKWGVPTAAFCTVQLSNEHFSFQERVDAKRGALPRRRPHVARAMRGLMSLLAEHGQSHRSLDEFYRAEEGLYVAFYPREFQFSGETFDDRYTFVGPNLTIGTDPGGWRPPADGRRVLMVSLGTSVFRNPGFYRACVDAFRDSDWQVVLHAHKGLDLDAVGELPPNVEVHGWLPQLAVLAHTDVLICHGGLGTLMAAFAEATPVVVVPNSGEQMVNGDRVAELGLGRVLAQQEITAAGLRASVEELHADQGVRARVGDMSAAIRRAGGGAHGADAVEGYLKVAGDRAREDNMSGACGANRRTQGDRERLPGACEGES